MAATIYATCPVHGQQELVASDLHLTIYSLGNGSYYTFKCKRCPDLVRKPADVDVIAALQQGKVPETFIKVPAEWAEHDDEAPPITWDDVLDFHLALGDAPDLWYLLLAE